VLVCAAWLLYFYGANLSSGWFGYFNFDSSELPIVTIYALYIPTFIVWMVKEKEFGFVKRFLIPIVAIISCAFMVFAAVYAHGVTPYLNAKETGAFSFPVLAILSSSLLLTFTPYTTTINIIAIPVGIINHSPDLPMLIKTLCHTLVNFYGLFFLLGTITVITEWEQIHCSKMKKISYLFTFPLFMLTYVPISVIALFKKVEWKPIKHSVSMSVYDICQTDPEFDISNN
jgi:hypothetical protein